MSFNTSSRRASPGTRRTLLAITVAAALAGTVSVASAQTYVGPGQSQDVAEGDAPRQWSVNQGSLNILPGGQTNSINAQGGAQIQAEAGTVGGVALRTASSLSGTGSHFDIIHASEGSHVQLRGGTIGVGGMALRSGASADIDDIQLDSDQGLHVRDSQLLLSNSTIVSNIQALDIGAASRAELNNVTVQSANGLGLGVSGGSHVELNDSRVEGARGAAYVGGGSSLVVSNSSLTGGVGLQVARFAGETAASAQVSNSLIQGGSAGAIVSMGSTLQIDGSTVTSTGAAGSLAGSHGLVLEGGNAAITGNSVVTGQEHGVQILVGRDGGEQVIDSTLHLDASHIHGLGGSAIQVGRGTVSEDIRADIILANGSTATGSNGVLLDVHNGAQVNLLADTTMLTGDIVAHGEDAQVDVQLRQASLVGRMINADAVTLDNGRWQLTGDSDVASLNVGAGSVVDLGGNGVAGTAAFNTLTVNGDYTGAGGTMLFNTVLGDDSSASDRLVIHGDSHGQTNVQVNNIGGAGAQTVDGIQLVQVDGASNGRFDLAGRAVGGQYEYFLFQGGKSDPTDGDWYLRSELKDGTVGPGEPGDPPPVPVLRPEPGAYLANQSAAVGMFQHGLHDRVGEPSFNAENNGAWARVSRNQADYAAVGEQLEISSDTTALQVGTDLFGWGAESRGKLGVMLGTGSANSQATSKLTGYGAKGKVRGQAIGLYGTWLQNPETATGAYVDGWLQYGRYQNSVEGQGLQKERYDARSATVSAETGYAFALGASDRSAWFIQPQLQLSYSDYRSDRLTERNGTVVESDDAGGLSSRVGVRIYGHTTAAGNKVQPFVAVNWLRDGGDNAMRFDGARVQADTPSSRVELKGGAQVQLGKNWTGWGDLGVQRGQDGYRNVSGQMGVRYSW